MLRNPSAVSSSSFSLPVVIWLAFPCSANAQAQDGPLDAQSVQVTAVPGAGAGSAGLTATVVPLAPLGTASVGGLELGTTTSCQPSWQATFGGEPGVDGFIYALSEHDDGSGPALYAGGFFSGAGGFAASHIAKWDGTAWSALGTGMNNVVQALAEFDDGGGPQLYAGGIFTAAGVLPASGIAKWNGTSWSALGSGVDGGVHVMTEFDDGSGLALFVGGDFASAGGVTAGNHIAKWSGTTWSALGGGTNGAVHALTEFDDGSGPALYAGGDFTSAGGVPASHIAKWNGTSWSALGSGVSGISVSALAQFDDGSGPAVYAGGDFTSAGGVAAGNYIARWDGTSWSALGTGVNGVVRALAEFDNGSGPALYAGGDFTIAGGVAASGIAKWDGTSWSALGSGISGFVHTLTEFDDGSGPALHAGGVFTSAGGVAANGMAKWDGASWSALGKGIDDVVFALTEHDDGSGPALYAGGIFTTAGGVPASHIAKWDGASWSALGSGMSGFVYALTKFDDGSGPTLYAGGFFTSAGGVPASYVAKWDGAGWSAPGDGVAGGAATSVLAMTEFDDGSGAALYAGGDFTIAGGVAANRIAKWDGASWSALGSGLDGPVHALIGFDDGSGPALYAGGVFTSAGGVGANCVARWDGTSWSALGSGASGTVRALMNFDDGTGPALHVGGFLTTAGGVAASGIAKWDGTSWSALGSGVGGMFPAVFAMTKFDDGSGRALYAGGNFTSAGSVAASHVAKWDGTSWSALGHGVAGPLSLFSVFALTEFDDGSGPALHAGGSFTFSPAGDSFVAKWGCAINSLPGCGRNPATLAALLPSAPLGAPLPLLITGSAVLFGSGIVYFGASGTDGSGCGLVVPGLGELLLALAPPPNPLASGVLASGTCDLSPLVPSTPSLSGVTVHLQGAALHLLAPLLIELTNALAVTLGP